jgi:negative regulator of sigma-B (phosphoserine phosphatase)
MTLDVAYRSIPMHGETVNGDGVVYRSEEGRSLLAVIDGLGHGPKAHEVAVKAFEVLTAVALDQSLESIMSELDDALRSGRGAAATVCLIDGDRLAGCGVGNVEMRAAGCVLPVVLSPGVLGGRVRTMRCFRGVLQPGARLVMFSDGISGRFALRDFDDSSASELCETLMSRFGKNQDDATVLVADVKETP